MLRDRPIGPEGNPSGPAVRMRERRAGHPPDSLEPNRGVPRPRSRTNPCPGSRNGAAIVRLGGGQHFGCRALSCGDRAVQVTLEILRRVLAAEVHAALDF